MDDIYSFVTLADELKKNDVLQATVEQILKQTIECGFFIQEYARRNFGGLCLRDLHTTIRKLTKYYIVRAITQPFLETGDLITKFCTEFTRLRANFDTGIGVHVTLVLSRAAPIVDAIRMFPVFNVTSHMLMICTQVVINCCQH
jgi:hypothetical protein